MTDPTTIFSILEEPAVQTASSAAAQGVSRLLRALHFRKSPHGDEQDTFTRIWMRAAENAQADWSPMLRRRLGRVRKAFQSGRIASELEFAELLRQQGINPDCAGKVLSELQTALDEAYRAEAGVDQAAFRPFVVGRLDEIVGRIDSLERVVPLGTQNGVDSTTLFEGLSEREHAHILCAQQTLYDTRDLPRDECGRHEHDLAEQRIVLEQILQRLMSDHVAEQTIRRVALTLAETDIQSAEIANDRRDFVGAADRYQRAVSSARRSGDQRKVGACLYFSGLCYLRGERYGFASHCFEQALGIAPNSPETLNNLAVCLGHLGRGQEALQLLDKAIPVYRELASVAPKKNSLRLLNCLDHRGRLRAEARQYEAAMEDVEEAITVLPQLQSEDDDEAERWSMRLHQNFGSLLVDMGRHLEALAHYDAALSVARRRETEDEDVRSHIATTLRILNTRGSVLQRLGRLVEALDAYGEVGRRASELASHDFTMFGRPWAAAANNVANLMRFLGMLQKAQEFYEQAIRIYMRLQEQGVDGLDAECALVRANLAALCRLDVNATNAARAGADSQTDS